MSGNFEYNKHFPHDEIRDTQTSAIDLILDAFVKDDKRFVILEAGTGVGKSAIGLTVARYMNGLMHPLEGNPGSYFVTTQKILQEQYVSDYGPPSGKLTSIKSSANYKCHFHKKNNCAESQKLLKTADKKSRFFNACAFNCVYKKAKQRFLDSPEGVTNFPYFMTEAAYSGKITRREVLVIDEAHNIESELSRFVEVSISERFVKSVLKTTLPRGMTQFQAFCWVRDVYFPKAKSQLTHFESIIEKADLREKLKELTVIAKQYDLLSRHVSKLEMFLSEYDKDNWVFDEEAAGYKSIRKFVFKSIDVSKYANQYLFRLGRKVLFMSATILSKDTFCRSLGIKPEDATFISIPSPFPIENRPVHFLPVGGMNAKQLQRTLPNLAIIVKQIMDQHKNEKGIIHCHTFKIAKYLKDNIKSRRILTHTSTDRDKVLQKHLNSKTPTVLLSPSMTEGVDLRGEYSRFQIICKVPYPYLGDKLIKKRMNKWKEWYPLQTAKTIVQAVGRSVRSDDDHAATYILDQDFDRFYRNNRRIFPKDFNDCLKTK